MFIAGVSSGWMAARHAGPEATGLLGTYFASGDLDELRRLVEAAGLQITASRTHLGTVKCPSVDAFVATEVESTPLRSGSATRSMRAFARGRASCSDPSRSLAARPRSRWKDT
jgi:hypothetical protein